MVPIDGMGTASVAPVMALPIPGMQKPPRLVGKWLRDLGGGAGGEGEETSGSENNAWLRQNHLGVNPHAVRHGFRGCVSFEAADGDDIVPGPDSDGEGARSAAQNAIGAIIERLEGWDDAAEMNPEEGGGEELGWQLAARIVPGLRNSRNMQSF